MDIEFFKSKAMEEDIPYQTLISSVIHQYAEWKIKALDSIVLK